MGGGVIFSCKIIPVPSHIFHDRCKTTTANGCTATSMNTHPLQKDPISASLQHYMNGGRGQRGGWGVFPVHVVGQREGEVLSDVTNGATGQMAAQPVISHLWTVLAVALIPFAPHFSCSHSSLCGYYLILIYSLPIRGLTTAISLLTHCSPTQDVNKFTDFHSTGRPEVYSQARQVA